MSKEYKMDKVKEEIKNPAVSDSCCGSGSSEPCCGGGESAVSASVDGDVRDTVQEYYAKAAKASCGCGDQSSLYYNEEMLNSLPDDVATFSLGCGNPIRAAEMKAGETVLDLGSGGGLDCFFAEKEVGKTGYVIGIDMTPEMLLRSTESAKKMGLDNVDFRKGFLEEMPVEDNTVDVVISNCVINLSPDKSLVFDEIFRVLKPGGRIAVSDIVVNGEIPEHILKLKDSWSSCAAGSLTIEDFTQGLLDAGLEEVVIAAKDANGDLLEKNPENELFSAIITAKKPI